MLLCFPLMADPQAPRSEISRAIQEFKVQTQNLGLRPGSKRRPGQRKSRSASFHGRVFWNFRNDILDAVPHEVTQTGGTKGILRRNQYGFNLSGPVVIPKLFHGGSSTFFTVSYEGMRETIGRSYLSTVALPGERGGDFGQTVDKAGEPLPIFDPNTTRPNPNYNPDQAVSTDNLQYLRDPYPLNAIPRNQLNPVAVRALNAYPVPNVNIGPYDQNNYTVYSPEVNKADGMRGNVDHTIGDRHRITAGFAFSNGFAGPAKYYETFANPGNPDRDYQTRSLSATHVFTISPNTINTFRASAWVSRSINQPMVDENGAVFPKYYFNPYLSMGDSYSFMRSASTHYGFSEGIAFRKGSHSLRASIEWDWDPINVYRPAYPSGRFDFGRGLTSLPGIVNTGHAFSSFLLGFSKYATGSIVEHPSYFRRHGGNIRIRDEWEARSGLTVAWGLTLTMNQPRTEKYNRQSTVSLDAINPENGRPGALIFAGRDGVGRSFLPMQTRPEYYVTLSWSPFDGSKTVVRGSVYRSWSRVGFSSVQWGTQGFNGTPTFITENEQLEPALTLRDGIPSPPNPLPDLRPEVANDTIADLIDQSGRMPRYDRWRVSLERQLPASIILTSGINRSTGRDIITSNDGADPNAISLDALSYRDLLNDEAFRRELRPYPQYQGFNVSSYYPAGRYRRTEGYLRLEKRTSQGLSLRAVYEFSKQMDNYRSRDGLQDYYHREKEWALTYYNDPHVLSLTYMYELPFGPNKQFMNVTGWKRYLVGGWAVSGVTTYGSGDPITLRAEFNNTGDVVEALYVNAVPGIDPQVEKRGPEQWFNANAFVNPPDFTIGNISRAHPNLYNPSRQNHDLSVTKRVSLASDRALEFIGTAFNFLNHANWNRPDADIGSLESPNTNAGKIIGSEGGRVIQLGLRLTF